MATLENEEKIKSITLNIRVLLNDLKDKLYEDMCEADWTAKHSTYDRLKDNNIEIRSTMASYLARVADIREVANEIYYLLKTDQNDIESKMWERVKKWEEEHRDEEKG